MINFMRLVSVRNRNDTFTQRRTCVPTMAGCVRACACITIVGRITEKTHVYYAFCDRIPIESEHQLCFEEEAVDH